jgi:Tol biopolymer transport system component
VREWNRLLENSRNGKIEIEIISKGDDGTEEKYAPIIIKVADEAIDPYICYRLLYPGYETYLQIKIIQRSLSDFNEKSVIENQLLGNNCVNCHAFSKNNPGKFLIHVRGSSGGTYFIDGNKIRRFELKTDEMKYGAVYPSWHPGGRYVAFSSNNIRQSVHSSPDENIEVTDLASSLVLYDTEKNEISPVIESDTVKYMETFPEWSPDGRYLYYCRASQYTEGSDISSIRYNLMRKSFDVNSGTFGAAEVVYDAQSIGKSVSFPRISPDGRYLVFTLHNFGNFSIWHKEADLYLLDIQTGKTQEMPVNSDETESYHCWSSNGKWLVFSSKRGDGLTARPYFAWFGSPDDVGKPFVLPQKDPALYSRMILTFNKPEFITGKITEGPRDFEKASKNKAVRAVWNEDVTLQK